jgi:Flp pilus assembly protein TadB
MTAEEPQSVLHRRGRLTRAGGLNLGNAPAQKALTLWAMAIGFVMRDRTQEGFSGLDMSLARMLAINLGIGVAVAVLLVPIGLLLGGFIVTFASTAMGTAIMAMGVGERDDEPRGGLQVVKQRAEVRH